MDFRHAFKRDVVIDMYGYRRLGHNEGDEPAFTQPLLYGAIQKRKPVREGYLDHLLKLQGLTAEEAQQIATHRQEMLEKALSDSQTVANPHNSRAAVPAAKPGVSPANIWTHYSGGPEPREEPDTGVAKDRLAQWLAAQAQWPTDFHPHPKIQKLLEARKKMAAGQQPLDWSTAEALALASVAAEGWRQGCGGRSGA